MKKAILLVCLLLGASALHAAETFESQIFSKQVKQVYGSGTLSTASEVYTILVLNGEKYMEIEVPKKAYDILRIGDLVKVTYEKGLFVNEIKGIALLRSAKKAAEGSGEGK